MTSSATETGTAKTGKGRLVLRFFGVLLALFSLFVVALIDAWPAFGAAPTGERLERMQAAPQWSTEEKSFVNPEPMWNGVGATLRDVMNGSDHAVPDAPLPVVSVEPSRFATPPESGLRITWLGHSTMIIEIDGYRFLTDPIWSERASPLTWLGPKRWYEPPLALDELPELDAVVISHDHYDHLDHETMIRLAELETTFVVPLGVGAHLVEWGVSEERIVELSWWESHQFGDLELVATPSRHASGRALWDKDRTLWAGYAFIGRQHRAFFSGDTGLFPALDEIGQRYGPFDVTMIEVGAYGQGWPDWHLGPEQAVRAHRMVQGQVMLPVHWGLMNLASHGWTAPIERTLVAAEERGVTVVAPRPGESFEPASPPPVEQWWPELPRDCRRLCGAPSLLESRFWNHAAVVW